MAIVGYERVSTTDQNTALQTDALTAAGCDRIFTDHASGSRTDRLLTLQGPGSGEPTADGSGFCNRPDQYPRR
jgi:hypothetical protein